nr:DUF5980 family protein [Micromonospora sp. DSM 115978]
MSDAPCARRWSTTRTPAWSTRSGTSPLWLFALTLPALDHGEYRWYLTASDGVETQRVPIIIKAQERWGCSV